MQEDTSTIDEQEVNAEEIVETVEQELNDDALEALSEGVEGSLTANDDPLSGIEEQEESQEAQEDSKDESKDKVEEVVDDVEETPIEETQTVDPGEFVPNDYSFEVKTADGKTVKISTPEQADELLAKLDENPELMSASQFGILNRKTAIMESSIETERKVFEAEKAQYEAEQALVETREEVIQQWDKEIKYLANRGEIPVISDDKNTANWSDPEIAKDPAVKARVEIFKWMETENNKRIDAGLEPIKSVLDAHNAMQLEAMKNEAQTQEVKEKDTRRKRGAMVGGDSPYIPESNVKGSIIGEGGSLNDLVNDFYMTQ
jgi:hypothetical protein